MQTFTGQQYLDIDIANCFGLDRLSWNERLFWVDNNRPDLEDLAKQAKYPILFRKAVRALRSVNMGFSTNHIMGLDATASGLQIMGALSGCKSTCKAVNLIDTGKRQDVYTAMADHMAEITGKKIKREKIKPVVMTVFYGSTMMPINAFGEGKKLVAFYDTIREHLTGAYELMLLIQDHWNPRAKYYQWTLPDGHTARVPVTFVDQKNIEVDEHKHMRFEYRAEVVKSQPQGRSLAANIVHSIDGWVVREMVAAANRQGFWMAPIHDCFYASPNHMNKVRRNYIEIIASITRKHMIKDILKQISKRKITYRPRTKKLHKKILKSDYALS